MNEFNDPLGLKRTVRDLEDAFNQERRETTGARLRLADIATSMKRLETALAHSRLEKDKLRTECDRMEALNTRLAEHISEMLKINEDTRKNGAALQDENALLGRRISALQTSLDSVPTLMSELAETRGYVLQTASQRD